MALVSLHTLLSAANAPSRVPSKLANKRQAEPRADKHHVPAKDSALTAVSSSPVTEASNPTVANVALCSSISSPELNAGGKMDSSEPAPQHPLHAASESSSDTGDLMFSELEVFADENNPSHVDENSNEENDVDDETMSGENDIEAASGGAGSGADILRRLVCAVASRGVTPAGTDGSTPAHAPPRHDYDPQLSTAAHTDMLLLNLMRMNGLTPKHGRTHSGSKRHWSSSAGSPEAGARRSTAAGRSRGRAATSPAAPRSRRQPPLSPGQLRHRPDTRHPATSCLGPHFAATPPGTPERGALSPVSSLALHDYWPSVSSVSDADDVEAVLDYNVNNDVQLNDTLFDMLLNSLAIEGGSSAGDTLAAEARPPTPPVQPWAPAAPHGPPAPHAPHERAD
ncbi:hypothetical protein PYW07_004082 [Mythimna separata]|uniref:Uncharacterized protein n=1 Tax=Mythimna separata TaxID=271217 RepID=A0AAD7YNC9_MYTSE|nr:hypothetical protein PYW07_004082 [Mythimna separata]